MYISIHISCTYISLYLVSYDAIILIRILSYEAQWPGFTPFPPLTLFLLRSSAWSMARAWQEEVFLELSVLRKYCGKNHEIPVLFAGDPRNHHHQGNIPLQAPDQGLPPWKHYFF